MADLFSFQIAKDYLGISYFHCSNILSKDQQPSWLPHFTKIPSIHLYTFSGNLQMFFITTAIYGTFTSFGLKGNKHFKISLPVLQICTMSLWFHWTRAPAPGNCINKIETGLWFILQSLTWNSPCDLMVLSHPICAAQSDFLVQWVDVGKASDGNHLLPFSLVPPKWRRNDRLNITYICTSYLMSNSEQPPSPCLSAVPGDSNQKYN